MQNVNDSATRLSAERIGPLLFCQGLRDERLQLVALVISPANEDTPALEAEGTIIQPNLLHQRLGYQAQAYRFSLPAIADTGYRIQGHHYSVNAAFGSDMRIAYVSCNGQENGDWERHLAERNVMWQRLLQQHAEQPFQLLLQGGDQIYADEMLTIHPLLKNWSKGEPHALAEPQLPADVQEQLHDDLFRRYIELYSQPEIARLMARVPSLAMWDDHDICDGWGSLPEAQLDAPVGRAVFAIARQYFLLFQFGVSEDNLPAMFLDARGNSLTWALQFPGFSLVAPDLRSERRPDQVMGDHGWHLLSRALSRLQSGQVFLLSSVPALGPRLSWVETVMACLPHQQKYEDDLRDQWQSRAHRDEWQRFLRHLLAVHEQPDKRVTILSGEIHLATHATMASRSSPLQQFVASGIAHPPPPRAYAVLLSLLAKLGEAPLPDHPIQVHALPGQRYVYTAERNYLLLNRTADQWSVHWELEHGGPTAAVAL